MFSQSNEDEIIANIFKRIGEGGKKFVEFGCGPGKENNTIALLKRGWSGVWADCRKKITNAAKSRWPDHPRLEIVRRVIKPSNVYTLFKAGPVDFLSIDIDGEDYAVWQAITAKPRVVCIEYDAVNGTALEPIVALGEAKGYEFVGISESKVNAFFIAS